MIVSGHTAKSGPVAQLGARVNGIHEVTGSTPVWSTNYTGGISPSITQPGPAAPNPAAGTHGAPSPHSVPARGRRARPDLAGQHLALRERTEWGIRGPRE